MNRDRPTFNPTQALDKLREWKQHQQEQQQGAQPQQQWPDPEPQPEPELVQEFAEPLPAPEMASEQGGLMALSQEELYSSLRDIISGIGDFDDDPGSMNVIGIRGLVEWEPVDDTPDAYNDTIAVLWRDLDGSPRIQSYLASVDPGLAYTEDPMNEKGCAHLVDGQYLYQIGMHKGEYEALVQAGPVTVWRDADGDFLKDTDEITETGSFGINIHAGGSEEKIGAWSAGCQVIFGGREDEEWQEFMDLMRSHPKDTILYTLVDRAILGFPVSSSIPA